MQGVLKLLGSWLKFFHKCHMQVLGSTDMPYFLSLDQEAMRILASKMFEISALYGKYDIINHFSKLIYS